MTRRPARKGVALVVAVLFAVMILSLWSVVFCELANSIRIQAALRDSQAQNQSATGTLYGASLTLLETLPDSPNTDYICLDATKSVKMEFKRDTTDTTKWTVTFFKDPPTDNEKIELPALPLSTGTAPPGIYPVAN